MQEGQENPLYILRGHMSDFPNIPVDRYSSTNGAGSGEMLPHINVLVIVVISSFKGLHLVIYGFIRGLTDKESYITSISHFTKGAPTSRQEGVAELRALTIIPGTVGRKLVLDDQTSLLNLKL